MVKADAGERRAGAVDEIVLAVEIDERIPAQARQAEQRQRDVAQDGVAGKQRDDLVGARHAEMARAPARQRG